MLARLGIDIPSAANQLSKPSRRSFLNFRRYLVTAFIVQYSKHIHNSQGIPILLAVHLSHSDLVDSSIQKHQLKAKPKSTEKLEEL